MTRPAARDKRDGNECVLSEQLASGLLDGHIDKGVFTDGFG